jgi:hypothetical protein
MDLVIVVQYLVGEMIFIFQINQIKIIQVQILDIHIFMQIMFIIHNKHLKNFQEKIKIMGLKQNNIKCINLYLNDKKFDKIYFIFYLFIFIKFLIIRIIQYV